MSLLEQPESCRLPLERRNIEYGDWVKEKHPEYIEKWERVIYFDPTEIYNRIGDRIDPFSRIHSIGIHLMFPDLETGMCGCGCKKKLTGRKKRWASEMCSSFAWDVHSIICNTHQRPGFFIDKYQGRDCAECGADGYHDLDHIVGVKHGGGGCWLSNYQYLCKECHRSKTNKDFGYKQNKQLKIPL